MIKLCIFDLDGTLADTLASIAYFGNEALRALGAAEIPTEEYRRFIGRVSLRRIQRGADRTPAKAL